MELATDSGIAFNIAITDTATPATDRCRASYGLLLFDQSFQYVLCCRDRYSVNFRNLLRIMHDSESSYETLSHHCALLSPREMSIVERQNLFIEAVGAVYTSKLINQGCHDPESRCQSHIRVIMRQYRKVARIIQSIRRERCGMSARGSHAGIERQWGPPKGGAAPLPNTETCLEAAIRETREETGLEPSDYEIVTQLPTFVHTFTRDSEPGSYVFAIVLYPAILRPESLEKIGANLPALISRQEVDDVALQPIDGLSARMSPNYGDAIEEFARTISRIVCQ